MDLQLNGKTAIATGSTAGIGFAIARTLALLASPLGAASNSAAVRVEGGTFKSLL